MSIGGGKKTQVSDGGSAALRDTAKKNADLAATGAFESAEQQQSFIDDFFTNYIDPAIQQVRGATDQAQAANKAIYDAQAKTAQQAEGLYESEGAAAQKKYFEEARNYDPAAEGERQAGLAIGDINQQTANAQQQNARAMQARGINPASGAGAMNSQQIMLQSALAKAKASAVARAQALAKGEQYTANAANAGAAVQQAGYNYRTGGVGTVGQMAGIPTSQLGAIGDASKAPMAGYQGVGQLYQGIYSPSVSGANAAASNITTASAESAKAAGAQQSGLGSLIGTGLAMAGKVGAAYATGGASLLVPSDRRLKRNIREVGTQPNGLMLYEYQYIWGPEVYTGFMADDVEKKYPHAVTVKSGYKMVDYSKVGVTHG